MAYPNLSAPIDALKFNRKSNHARVVIAFVAVVAGLAGVRAGPAGDSPRAALSDVDIGQRLRRGYPELVTGVQDGDVRFADGTAIAVDDPPGKKPFKTWLADPSIRDMFRFAYQNQAFDPPSALRQAPLFVDPGRARHLGFFRKIYGDCRNGEVSAHLEKVRWLSDGRGKAQHVAITRINGAAERLRAVVAALEKLPKDRTRFLVPSAGGYHCRAIAGTDQMSAHGFGIAVDIATTYADYWRWPGAGADNNKRASGGARRLDNRIPYDIVAAFEAHGFIWGGRWHHFDTMHFEYRPELLPPAAPRPEGDDTPSPEPETAPEIGQAHGEETAPARPLKGLD